MILTKLPAHLEKFEKICAKPMNGKTFCKYEEHWFDPISETMFWANGHGYFESGAWGIAEHPDVPLVRWNEEVKDSPPKVMGGTTYGFDELRSLIEYIQNLAPPKLGPNINPPHWWWQETLNLLDLMGVKFDRERIQIQNDGLKTTFYTNVKGYTAEIDKRLRAYFDLKHAATKLVRPFVPTNKEKEKRITMADTEEKLQTLWAQIGTDWNEAGLDPNEMLNLLERVCADLNLDFALSPESVEAFENAAREEIKLATYQDDASEHKIQATVQESTTEAPLTQEEISEFFAPEPEDADIMNQARTQLIVIVDRAVLAGIPESEARQMHKNLTIDGDGLDSDTLNNFQEAIDSLIQVRGDETEAADALTGTLPAAPAEEPAQKKGRQKKGKAEKPAVEPPKNEMFEKPVTNVKDGTVSPFKDIMNRFATLNLWKTYHNKEGKRVDARMRGIFFLFWHSIFDIVHEQFMRQYNRETGVFKPATVTTPWGNFGRKPIQNGGPTCTDRLTFVSWLNELTPEEAVFFGGAIEVKCTATDDAVKAAMHQGLTFPGWNILPENPDHDPVGEIYVIGAKPLLKNLDVEPVEDDVDDEDSEDEAA